MAKQDTSARKGKAEPGKGCDGNQACSGYLFLQLYRKFQLLAARLGKPHLVTLSEQTEKKEGEPNEIPLWIQPPVSEM